LLHALAYRFLTRIEVAETEIGVAAGALAVGLVAALGNAAGAGLVLGRHEGAVLIVDREIVALGDAVFSGADLFAGITDFAVLIAEGAPAIDAEAYRLSLA
jgi:hypothetical protein